MFNAIAPHIKMYSGQWDEIRDMWCQTLNFNDL